LPPDIGCDTVIKSIRRLSLWPRRSSPVAGLSRPARINADARCLDRPDLGLWAVADGAGGHDAGALASTRITEALDGIPSGLDAPELLVEIRARVGAVHQSLIDEAERLGPEATVASTVLIFCIRRQHFACLWAGDSRAYRWCDGSLQRLTRDHSLVQELVDIGELEAEEAEDHPRANVITRAVGAGEAEFFVLDKVTDLVRSGDRFLLCSDGLTKSVSEDEIGTLLQQAGDDAAPLFITAALAREARDNVTAIVIHVDEVDEAESAQA
jgi:serine/threonine protein phosphatase PrpC